MALRILHVTPYYEAAWGYGGIPRAVSVLTRGLAARGHRLTVCTTDAADGASRLADGAAPNPPGVEVHVFPNLSNALAYRRQLFLPRGLKAFLRRRAGDFDVAHLHGCHHLPGAIAARWLRRAGVPYVLTPNGTAPRIERRRLAKVLFDVTVGRRVLPGAARVVAVSGAEVSQLGALGVAADRIEVIPNAVEEPRASGEAAPQPERFRQRFALAGGEPIVLYLGTLTPRKRVGSLVEAFARLPASGGRLVIAGNDLGAGAAVRRRVRRLGLGEQTVFTGLLRDGERFDALAAAAVVVYPSQHEIFGLVPLEALLCGTPAVVADDSGCGEIVASIGGRTVPLGDVAALSAALAEILAATPAARREEAAAAAAKVRRRFAAEPVCAAHERLYESVLASQPLRSRAPAGRRPPLHGSSAPGKERGVSFVIPVHNGERHLEATLAAILEQADGREVEVIAVDDGSTDGSRAILERFAAERGVRLLAGGGRGAAAALNLGLAAARHPMIAQVDQDVIVGPGWLACLAAALEDPTVAAAQGRFAAAEGASLWARVTDLDLEARTRRLPREVDHVCTGNVLYRAAALERVGGFEEDLGYGYDNDLAYRLGEAGFRLVRCREARAVHGWPETAWGYLRQQYGQGYGRLDLVARHRRRLGGDDVSGPAMMIHAPAMALATAALGAAPALSWVGGPWRLAVGVATAVAALLFAERLTAGARAYAASGDRAAWAFAPVHLLRDLAWTAAIAAWGARRLLGRPRRPQHSMPRVER